MEYNEIVSVISSVGFPIVAYGAMFWYMVKQNHDHKEEMNELRNSLENNTIALTKLADAMKDNSK